MISNVYSRNITSNKKYMSPYKEAMIQAQDFPPYIEAYQNSEHYDEFVNYLADEMGRELETDELDEASDAWHELNYKYSH